MQSFPSDFRAIPNGTVLSFVITIQLLASALAAADLSGRLPAMGMLPLLAGDVLGPSLAGAFFESDGLTGVTIAACVAAIAAAALLLVAMFFQRAAADATRGVSDRPPTHSSSVS